MQGGNDQEAEPIQCPQMDDRRKPSARPQPALTRTASLSILTPGQAGVEKERGLIRTNLEGSGCYTPPIRLSWPVRSWAGVAQIEEFYGRPDHRRGHAGGLAAD